MKRGRCVVTKVDHEAGAVTLGTEVAENITLASPADAHRFYVGQRLVFRVRMSLWRRFVEACRAFLESWRESR